MHVSRTQLARPTNSFASARWRGYSQPDTTVVAIHIRLDCVGTSANVARLLTSSGGRLPTAFATAAGPLLSRLGSLRGGSRQAAVRRPAMTQIRLNGSMPAPNADRASALVVRVVVVPNASASCRRGA